MADINDYSKDVSIHNEATDVAVTTTTDRIDSSTERLDVEATVKRMERVAQSVQETEAESTSRNKVEYTVPTGKVLYVQFFTVSIEEGKMVLGFQVGGSTVYAVGLDENATSAFGVHAPDNNPFGPVSAGTEVRIRRTSGDSGKNWSAAFFGYLEDV